MLEFKVIEEFLPHVEVIKAFKEFKCKYRVHKGTITKCLKTNLQFIQPTIYLITYPAELIIHEYHVNEISDKHFYIREYKQKYNLKEVKNIISNLK